MSFASLPTEGRTEGSSCPLGFICDATRKVNCTLVRLQASQVFKFGDVHAGLYCPEGKDDYQNCPVGHYCPDPETLLPCPSGKFCPHKTALPEIECYQCEQGADTLARETYGYVMIIIMLLSAIMFIAIALVRRYRKDLYAHLVSLQARQIDSLRLAIGNQERNELFVKIRPRLELVASRLGANDKEKEAILRVTEDGRIRFNALKLFDSLDADGSGTLSFQEVNKVLELNSMQLHEFVRRMNELAHQPVDTKEVTRSVFCNYFLDALAESNNFGPTEEEAGHLFDEIARHGTMKNGEVPPESLYTSPLANFLTDSQIHELLVSLRKIQMKRLKEGLSVSLDTERSPSSFASRRNTFSIGKDVFVDHYPRLLNEIAIRANSASHRHDLNHAKEEEQVGVDISFEDLCLSVAVGDNGVNVVDSVTGRLKAKTMTALMGGSGAGKTSLLNALCGRAFYGTVSGTIKVNGHPASIEDHTSNVGFVPQDDIVYPELTVRENFIFSGRFQLPKGTHMEEIEDLADATMASLGLSRVANSMVGDVTRRGVSGGEKKRVNIGLELMSRPSVLFLDEPTSGLDSSSALLVMKSLKTLVENNGVTVCSVIHQPRKIIFDLFDSLVLLGVGGRMVYHGPTSEAEAYFMRVNYTLPPGESVADWLIDISSGRLEPDKAPSSESVETMTFGSRGDSGNRADNAFEEAKVRRAFLYQHWVDYFNGLDETALDGYRAPVPYALPGSVEKPTFWTQLWAQLERNWIVFKRNAFSKLVDTFLIVGSVILISLFEGITEVTVEQDPNVQFGNLISGNPQDLVNEFPNLFKYAWIAKVLPYGHKIGVIAAVLVGLTAAKTITEKRLEFFREAGSGYDINAYFISINITTTLEHSIQIILSACCAFWIRDSLAKWHNYYINFLMLTWVSVSWALLIPLLVPSNNVVLAVGFYMAFFALLFSGGTEPITYEKIYEQDYIAILSGFLSPTRFFVESLAVAEWRCLPSQSGFTVSQDAVNFPISYSSFSLLHLADNDPNVVERTFNGWYWGVLPAFVVGLTIRVLAGGVIHVSDRSKQAKRSLANELPKLKWHIFVFVLVVAGMAAIAIWLMLRLV